MVSSFHSFKKQMTGEIEGTWLSVLGRFCRHICITINMVSVTRMIIESDLYLVVDWEISQLWIMVSYCFTHMISCGRSVIITDSLYKFSVFFHNMQNNFTRCMYTDIECRPLPQDCYFLTFSFYVCFLFYFISFHFILFYFLFIYLFIYFLLV